ncbi:MAG: HNH endonuclease [Terrimicrobiaceae bacterium]|nr:HNH endonuclease [Terrimicrobiaceae bacterium]
MAPCPTMTSPQTFVIREECQKAAWQNGYRRALGESDGWAAFESTTAAGTIWLAAESDPGPWLLALDHAGVIAELGLPPVEIPGPGLARFRIETLEELYRVLSRVYQLAASLPDAPLVVFQQNTASLSKTTEAERLVVQRIGQDIFREGLMEYWQGRCPLTGITDPALLRASHIVPWSECESDAQRLDIHNGLLLSALWDAAFDRALVTFTDEGTPLFSPTLSTEAREALTWKTPLKLTAVHQRNLQSHRSRFTAGAFPNNSLTKETA